MALTPGTRLGVYDITAPIGEGGMGQVFRARDTKLHRNVAVKVLLPAVANDPDRLARFSREAQLLASLNHPNIAGIYGLEDQGDTRALVMELVEGQTLADRLARGAIPVQEALAIAKQILEALAAAHEAGVVHRDLKPANIKVRDDDTVKVLDFGLAKALDPPSVGALDVTTSPTLTVHTDAGLILGTAAYMSPEQAKGLPVDKRADLWAFGAVLFEMLTGHRAFRGDGISDTMARVLMEEPDWTALPANTPPAIRTLLRRCLEKDRRRRLDSAAAARFTIEDAGAAHADGSAAAGVRRPRRGAVVFAAVAAAAATATMVWVVMRPASQPAERPSRFAIVPPPAQPLNVHGDSRDIALSPDGRRLVYRSGGSMIAGSPLMIRAVDQLDAQPLAGVSGALGPFFSADGRWIGFFENSELRKISVSGGPVITICTVSGTSRGASWGDDNTIVFATSAPNIGLWRVSADGGQPTVLTTPDAAQPEAHHGFPSMLPGGRSVLFTVTGPAGAADNSQVAVLDLKTRTRKTLIRGGSDAEYVEPGYLLYAAAGTLRAVRFDPGRLEVIGDSMPVVDHVIMSATGAANYAVSRTGTLIYLPAGVGAQTMPRTLLWVDRRGYEEPINAPPRAYSAPRLSPDGTQIVVESFDRDNDLWIWDLVRQTLRQFTFDPAHEGMPLWTRDGRRIIFESTRSGAAKLYEQSADGTGPIERLVTTAIRATAITPDGTRVIGFEVPDKAPAVVVAFPHVTGRSEPLSEIRFAGIFAEISPDGHYIAYQSNESGQVDIYVRPFPEVDSGRWRISTSGGTRAAWARSGRELFYLDSSNTLIAVPVQTSGSTFSSGNQAKVFDAKYSEPFPARHYDVSADGQRFLMLRDSAAGDPNVTPASMVVVLNWFEELKARAPTK